MLSFVSSWLVLIRHKAKRRRSKCLQDLSGGFPNPRRRRRRSRRRMTPRGLSAKSPHQCLTAPTQSLDSFRRIPFPCLPLRQTLRGRWLALGLSVKNALQVSPAPAHLLNSFRRILFPCLPLLLPLQRPSGHSLAVQPLSIRFGQAEKIRKRSPCWTIPFSVLFLERRNRTGLLCLTSSFPRLCLPSPTLKVIDSLSKSFLPAHSIRYRDFDSPGTRVAFKCYNGLGFPPQ